MADALKDLNDLFEGMQVIVRANRAPSQNSYRLERRSNNRPIIYASYSLQPFADRTVELGVDLSVLPRPQGQILRDIFGLSVAETQLALKIAEGKAIRQIATESGVSISTSRTHLRSILAKTDTRRQSELVALLGRVAVLFGVATSSTAPGKKDAPP